MTFQETPLKCEHVIRQDITNGVLQAIDAKANVSLTIDVAKVSPGVAWPDTFLNSRLREFSQVSAQRDELAVASLDRKKLLTNVTRRPFRLGSAAMAIQGY